MENASKNVPGGSSQTNSANHGARRKITLNRGSFDPGKGFKRGRSPSRALSITRNENVVLKNGKKRSRSSSDNSRSPGGFGSRKRGGRHSFSNIGGKQERSNYSRQQQHFKGNNRGRRGNRGSNGSRENYRSKNKRREYVRNHPTGLKDLMKWQTDPPDVIVTNINGERSGFKFLINDTKISPDKMICLMRLLGKASSSQSARHGLREIYLTVFTDKFINELVSFSISLSKQEQKVIEEYITNQLTLLTAYSKAMPLEAVDKLDTLISQVKMVLSHLTITKGAHFKKLEDGYFNLEKYCYQFKQKKEKTKQNSKARRFDGLERFDDYEHIDSFRQLPLVPNMDDIIHEGRPIIKRNIVDKSYKDVETYLDVHFRLLREDFVGPLRDGIQKYRSDKYSKLNDIRIYKNVQPSGSNIVRGKLVHFMKLNLPNKFKIESSKRLLYGNVLCLSHDDFKTFTVCTVSERNENQLRNGIIGISVMDSGSKIDFSKSYTVAESRSFYTAYKPVLEALQNITEQDFPLVDQIVFVDENVTPPIYIIDRDNCDYDLRVVNNDCLMKSDDDEIKRFLFGWRTPSPPVEHNELSNVRINSPLEEWPSKEIFNFDASQMKAFHSALTRKFVIIQGPPGTGKTFLGLKITQALLHNSNHWSANNENRLNEVEQVHEDRQNEEAEQRVDEDPQNEEVGQRGNEDRQNEEVEQRVNEDPQNEEVEERVNEDRQNEEVEPRGNEAPQNEEVEQRVHEGRQNGGIERRVNEDPQNKGIERRVNEYTDIVIESDNDDLENEIANSTPPILVLCYTNHALDQFLEGMLKFTNKIVRIGGRSKSEDIQRYQINNFVSSLVKARRIPDGIHYRNYEIRDRIREVESLFNEAKREIDELFSIKGILKLSYLNSQNVLPEFITRQFDDDKSFMEWILDMKFERNVNDSQPTFSPTYNDNDEFMDAMELQKQEEENRLLELDDEEPLFWASSMRPLNRRKQLCPHDFIITTGDIKHKIDLWKCRQHPELYPSSAFSYLISEFERKLGNMEYAWECFNSWPKMRQLKDYENIFTLSFEERCMLYGKWRHLVGNNLRTLLQPYKTEYMKLYDLQKEMKLAQYLYVSRYADVIGMTTTGAAEYRAMIQDLKPKIVIVEEAAEILEAHIVTSLPSSCEHLIMIGDHQQLKPNTAVYDLAKKYNLEVSLFERMIKNNLLFETLEFQHRMRPEISDLLVPTIYPNLKDHDSVNGRPNILGMTKNVFFLKHDEYELGESDDNNSHSNEFEADLIVRLARHLLLQGYSTDQITILTPYSGQFFLLRKKIRNHNVCNGLRISVVDNFQGEENDIILLSLVRSNSRCNVGFLKVENRVCVALSRAKFGMYIVGNMNQLCSANPVLWPKINSSLEEQGAIGKTMTLKCQNHPLEISEIATGEDIRLKSPEGGCRKLCNTKMSKCSHICSRICHSQDMKHEQSKCDEECGRKCPKRNHDCPAKCYQECPPCAVIVERELPCGHTHSFPCHIPRSEYNCPTLVQKRIEPCGHPIEIACHKTPNSCPTKCDVRLDCGHACRYTCHVENDPKHLKYICYGKCTLKNKNCSQDHKCRLYCSQNCIECKVGVEKEAPCGHKVKVPCSSNMLTYVCKQQCRKLIPGCGHDCKLKCSEPCGGCQEMVMKVIPECGHENKFKCSGTPKKSNCKSNECPVTLQCGHKCRLKCAEDCSVGRCEVPVPSDFKCPKDHNIQIPCHLSSTITKSEDAWIYCDSPCNSELDCKHKCSGKCHECLHGRVHAICNEKCEKTLVCGHLCKSPCSAACPPCQAKCQWRCKHSKCNKTCGIMCTPCNELCEPSCEHKEPCGKKCGEICDCEPCDKPCPEKLPCGHDCIGFCGDPCPELCRECHLEELSDFILLGNEDEPDARFVKLLDCGHVIEVEGLISWLERDVGNSVQMVTCPRECRQPIYNTRRFKNIVLKTYSDVQKVLTMNTRGALSFKDISERLTDITIRRVAVANTRKKIRLDRGFGRQDRGFGALDRGFGRQDRGIGALDRGFGRQDRGIGALDRGFGRQDRGIGALDRGFGEVERTTITVKQDYLQFSKCVRGSGLFKHLFDYLTATQSHTGQSKSGKKLRQPMISQEKLNLYDFQSRLLEEAVKMKSKLDNATLEEELIALVNRVFDLKIGISPQLISEVNCELDRLKIRKNTGKVAENRSRNTNLAHFYNQIVELMNPTEKFTKETEKKVTEYLKLCEPHLASLEITDVERKQILSAMSGSVRQGAWYKCPNGHIYCISDCGGAMEEGVCPECKSVIGGRCHALRDDNTLATEMDGAARAAWPQGRF